uniref:Uncharacterized protein n=1 Tax=Euplotes harpa TaxID=151035 RepID=A0A7S3J5A9_9SPIT|mmetsp:Transcript_2090/g.2651  ORF Transcript_2090/g.2651 Transcript_2090/m.2651 type:complete len:159 (+) Transcript_2090:249-725(+)
MKIEQSRKPPTAKGKRYKKALRKLSKNDKDGSFGKAEFPENGNNEDARQSVLPILEEEENSKNNDITDMKEDAQLMPSKSKSNTNVKLSVSARIKSSLKDGNPIESPLPVVFITNNDKVDVERTDGETPREDDQEVVDPIAEIDEGKETDRKLVSKTK